MRTIVAGSRSGFTYYFVSQVLNAFLVDGLIISEVVSGTANGVDKFGEIWATNADIPTKRFPADWDKYGKSAGYRRNAEMAEYANALVAFWDGESRGTKNMIDTARSKNLEVIVITLQRYPDTPI